MVRSVTDLSSSAARMVGHMVWYGMGRGMVWRVATVTYLSIYKQEQTQMKRVSESNLSVISPRHRRSGCATPPAPARPEQKRRNRRRSGGRPNELLARGRRLTLHKSWSRPRDQSSALDSPRCCTGRRACHGVLGPRCSSKPMSLQSRSGQAPCGITGQCRNSTLLQHISLEK